MFSHAVIDHVSDIDNFLTKAINLSNRYVYISAYRGFFPGIEHHMMNYDNKDGCYYNDVSVKQVERLMEKLGKSDEEYLIRARQVVIRKHLIGWILSTHLKTLQYIKNDARLTNARGFLPFFHTWFLFCEIHS